jgi:sec-independent protein translocase protein TatC
MKLIWIGIIAVLSLIIGIILSNPLYSFILTLIPEGVQFIAYNPSDGFMTIMWVTVAISVIFFLLGLLCLLWYEYHDALYKKERDFLIKSFAPSIFLFIVGNVFGLFLYTQFMLPFFIQTNTDMGLVNYWNLYQVIQSGIGMAIMLGIAFQLPIILRALIKYKFIEKKDLKSKRGMVAFVLLIVSGIITPSPDILSQFLVAIPLYVLFEVSIL